MNFCECGFLYDPREVGRHPNPQRRGRYNVYRGEAKKPKDFSLDSRPPPEKMPKEKEEVPGWMWAKRKKQKQLREEAQGKIQYETQLNMFEKTVSGAQNRKRKRKAPKVSESYGEPMEGASAQKKAGQGSDRPAATYGLGASHAEEPRDPE